MKVLSIHFSYLAYIWSTVNKGEDDEPNKLWNGKSTFTPSANIIKQLKSWCHVHLTPSVVSCRASPADSSLSPNQFQPTSLFFDIPIPRLMLFFLPYSRFYHFIIYLIVLWLSYFTICIFRHIVNHSVSFSEHIANHAWFAWSSHFYIRYYRIFIFSAFIDFNFLFHFVYAARLYYIWFRASLRCYCLVLIFFHLLTSEGLKLPPLLGPFLDEAPRGRPHQSQPFNPINIFSRLLHNLSSYSSNSRLKLCADASHSHISLNRQLAI